MTIQEIKHFFDTSSNRQIVCLRAELDRFQDQEDEKAKKHVEIPVTVAILSELLYRSEVAAQIRKEE